MGIEDERKVLLCLTETKNERKGNDESAALNWPLLVARLRGIHRRPRGYQRFARVEALIYRLTGRKDSENNHVRPKA